MTSPPPEYLSKFTHVHSMHPPSSSSGLVAWWLGGLVSWWPWRAASTMMSAALLQTSWRSPAVGQRLGKTSVAVCAPPWWRWPARTASVDVEAECPKGGDFPAKPRRSQAQACCHRTDASHALHSTYSRLSHTRSSCLEVQLE